MTLGAAALAWGGAVAALLLAVLVDSGWIGPAGQASASHVGLVALPWIALAALPQAVGGRPVPAGVALALFLPPVVLAAQLDLSGGVPVPSVVTTCAGVCVLASLLFVAGRRGRGTPYAVAWVLVLAGPPLLLRATGAPAASDGVVAGLAASSPLEQVLRVALGADGGGAPGWGLAVVGTLLLVAVARGVPGPGSSPGSEASASEAVE